jgi:hypothetical protein
MLLEYIVGVKISMCHFLRVNMIQRYADHCEDSKNMLFWNGVVLIADDKVCKTLVTFFHNKAWKVVFIFDKVNDSHNHGVIDSS